MACGCSKGSSSARPARRDNDQPSGSAGGYEFEVTYNTGGTDRFRTEQEAMAALSVQGGGFRMVPRG